MLAGNEATTSFAIDINFGINLQNLRLVRKALRSVPLFPVGDGDEWAACEDGRIYASLPQGAPTGLLKADWNWEH